MSECPTKPSGYCAARKRPPKHVQNFKQDTGQAFCHGDGYRFRVCSFTVPAKVKAQAASACNTAGEPPRQGCATEQTKSQIKAKPFGLHPNPFAVCPTRSPKCTSPVLFLHLRAGVYSLSVDGGKTNCFQLLQKEQLGLSGRYQMHSYPKRPFVIKNQNNSNLKAFRIQFALGARRGRQGVFMQPVRLAIERESWHPVLV